MRVWIEKRLEQDIMKDLKIAKGMQCKLKKMAKDMQYPIKH